MLLRMQARYTPKSAKGSHTTRYRTHHERKPSRLGGQQACYWCLLAGDGRPARFSGARQRDRYLSGSAPSAPPPASAPGPAGILPLPASPPASPSLPAQVLQRSPTHIRSHLRQESRARMQVERLPLTEALAAPLRSGRRAYMLFGFIAMSSIRERSPALWMPRWFCRNAEPAEYDPSMSLCWPARAAPANSSLSNRHLSKGCLGRQVHLLH